MMSNSGQVYFKIRPTNKLIKQSKTSSQSVIFTKFTQAKQNSNAAANQGNPFISQNVMGFNGGLLYTAIPGEASAAD